MDEILESLSDSKKTYAKEIYNEKNEYSETRGKIMEVWECQQI